MINSPNEKNIALIEKIVLKDEYEDSIQNTNIYEDSLSGADILYDFFKRNFKPGEVLDLGCGSGDIFEQLPEITYAIEPNPKRFEQAKQKTKEKVVLMQSWCENTRFLDSEFSTVLTWGCFCFVRSPMEALIEINRILEISGIFILDVNRSSPFAIVQTVDISSFIRWVSLFGFELVEKRSIESDFSQDRVALAFCKIENFNYRNFLMPQCVGTINNYLPKRDWSLK